MKTLKAGDIRQPDDEVRHIGPKPKLIGWNYTNQEEDYYWQKVSLVDQPILRSDLMVAEFRRP